MHTQQTSTKLTDISDMIARPAAAMPILAGWADYFDWMVRPSLPDLRGALTRDIQE